MRVQLGIVLIVLIGLIIEFHKMQEHLAVTHGESVRSSHAWFVQDVALNFIRKQVVIRRFAHVFRQRELPWVNP